MSATKMEIDRSPSPPPRSGAHSPDSDDTDDDTVVDLSRPSSAQRIDAWDDNHVKLPCAPHNIYQKKNEAGTVKNLSAWYLLSSVLRSPIDNAYQLREVIMSYNDRVRDFSGLHSFFHEIASYEETNSFFRVTLPRIVDLALRLPELFPAPIPLLAPGVERELVFSREQISCLLANAFLCTFPGRNSNHRHSRYPSFNFDDLFFGNGNEICLPMQAGKLRCLMNYFKRVTSTPPTGNVSFYRRMLFYPPDWGGSSMALNQLFVTHDQSIEDAEGMLQVDFSNRYIGGGVLGKGCVQEEIRFLICPELIASRLFTAPLGDRECLIMTGAERFSSYSGYSSTFMFEGDYLDKTPMNFRNMRNVQLVAVDALQFSLHDPLAVQFSSGCLDRELNKAYCGFGPLAGDSDPAPVATGHWGCGAFGGDKALKFIVQLMACSEAGRGLYYHTFGDAEFAEAISRLHSVLARSNVTVGQLYCHLRDYRTELNQATQSHLPPNSVLDLFSYLLMKYPIT